MQALIVEKMEKFFGNSDKLSQPLKQPQSVQNNDGYTSTPRSAADRLTPENKAMVDEYVRELVLEQEAEERSSHSSVG